MKTYFLGDEEVRAYIADLARRLLKLDHGFPLKWFVLGQSGAKIAECLYDKLPSGIRSKILIVPCTYDRASGHLKLPEIDLLSEDDTVLLIDSAVHSGRSMAEAARQIACCGAKSILSYTLVLKRGSVVVPTYFGVLISDNDRAIFQLKVIPNNRLAEKPPFGVLKILEKSDLGKLIGLMPEPFASMSIGDLLYQDEAYNLKTYIYEISGRVAGFVSMALKEEVLFVDAWATCVEFQGKGIGSATLRWAETLGRSEGCSKVRLWAFEPAIPTYQKYGYEFVGDSRLELGGASNFRLMQRSLMHLADRGN